MSFNRLGACALLLLSACTTVPQPTAPMQPSEPITVPATQYPGEQGSFEMGRLAVENRLNQPKAPKRAKNVILFVGDGMGVSTVTAIRIHAGQKIGKTGEEHILAMESLPHAALSKTYNTNQQVSDSAGTATALMTGQKTKAGVINVAPEISRNDCAGSLAAPLDNFLLQAADQGYSTGVVSTARLTHATPATTYSNSPNRDWESLGDLPELAKKQGCIPIAAQLEAALTSGRLDIAMGGGKGEFETGVEERVGGTYIENKESLGRINSQSQLPMLGLFSNSHMEFVRAKDETNKEPSLADMTAKAIDRLDAEDNGYFLMVEGGRIDHGHHAGRAELALDEGVAFDEAVAQTLSQVDLSETLIIITADHSHVFTIAGYPTRGNPILDVVKGNDEQGVPNGEFILATDGLPYTTLGYQNGPGAVEGVRDPSAQPGEVIIQKAAIPTGYISNGEQRHSETHAGEDVPIFAIGPSSDLVSGVMEQNVIYHIMRKAMGF